MDDYVLSTFPRTPRNERINSLRMKKYIRIYSGNKATSRDYTQKRLKITEFNLSIPNNNTDSSRIFLKAPLNPNLEKIASSLSYEIQKANSDKAEILRDISTYDYNFSKSHDLFIKFQKLNNLAYPLLEADGLIEGLLDKEKYFYNSFVTGLDRISKINEEKNPLTTFEESENFGIKLKDPEMMLVNLYKGFVVISGNRCLLTIHGDKWLQNLEFSVEMINGKKLYLVLSQTMSNLYGDPNELLKAIQYRFLPFLSFSIERKKLRLVYDEKQGNEHYNLYVKLKGFVYCIVQVKLIDFGHLQILVPIIDQILNVNLSVNCFELFENKTKLQRTVKEKLIYSKLENCCFWQKNENIFEYIEKNSKLLDDDYIRSHMDIRDHFEEIYSLDFSRISAKLSCFTYKEQVILRISYGNEIVEIDSKSRLYNFLLEFQYLDIIKNFKTLASSLELEFVAAKLIPHIKQSQKKF